MAGIDEHIKDIIKEIRKLDIESKSLLKKRVNLVHKLETALEVTAAVERELSLDTILYRHGERIEITNKVTPGTYGGRVEIQDTRGTVLIQKKTDRGQTKVFFRTDRGINTHRLVKNIRRVDPEHKYEVQRSKAIQARSKQAKSNDIKPGTATSSS